MPVKSEILALLKKNQTGFISGEEISDSLQVSRTAIWKHIKALREDGYGIESHPRVGYRLVSVPDRLYPDEITSHLRTRIIGKSVVYFPETVSTNDAAKELAAAGMPEGTVVVAEEQTGGRGRLGRAWHSPTGGGIWLSVILRPDINPMDAPKITLLTAVALARTLAAYPEIIPGIKWPNDVLVEGKKIVGILTEMNAEMDRVNYIVLGIGVNINTVSQEFPDELRNIATSLLITIGRRQNRLDFLANMLQNLEELYLMFTQGRFPDIIKEWKKFSVTLGQRVRIAGPHGDLLEGVAQNLDADGALILKTAAGEQRVLAGEVIFT
jgi:BirA family biotin operon repressor/biotin-[acetyl-CoA-carboxylase] ligase